MSDSGHSDTYETDSDADSDLGFESTDEAGGTVNQANGAENNSAAVAGEPPVHLVVREDTWEEEENLAWSQRFSEKISNPSEEETQIPKPLPCDLAQLRELFLNTHEDIEQRFVAYLEHKFLFSQVGGMIVEEIDEDQLSHHSRIIGGLHASLTSAMGIIDTMHTKMCDKRLQRLLTLGTVENIKKPTVQQIGEVHAQIVRLYRVRRTFTVSLEQRQRKNIRTNLDVHLSACIGDLRQHGDPGRFFLQTKFLLKLHELAKRLFVYLVRVDIIHCVVRREGEFLAPSTGQGDKVTKKHLKLLGITNDVKSLTNCADDIRDMLTELGLESLQMLNHGAVRF